MHLTAEQEQEIRLALTVELQSVDTSGPVFAEYKYFKDKKDFYTVLKQFGYNATMPYVGFIQIGLVGYENKDRSIYLRYRINVFDEYFAATITSLGSTAQFNALFINILRRFKQAIDITDYAEVTATVEGDIKLDDKNEFYKGLYGHHVNFIATVEIGDC